MHRIDVDDMPDIAPLSFLLNVTDDRVVVRYFMLQERATEARRDKGVNFRVGIPETVFSESEAGRLWHHHGEAGDVEVVDGERLIMGEHVASAWQGLMVSEIGAVVLAASQAREQDETLFGFRISIAPERFQQVLPPVNLTERYDFVTRPTTPAVSGVLKAEFAKEQTLCFLKVRVGPRDTFFDAAYHITQPIADFPVVGTPIDVPDRFSNNNRYRVRGA